MATKQLTNPVADISQRQAAMVTGWAIVGMAIFAGFAHGFVSHGLVVPGDATTTANNIKASEMLFRIGIFGWLVTLSWKTTDQ